MEGELGDISVLLLNYERRNFFYDFADDGVGYSNEDQHDRVRNMGGRSFLFDWSVSDDVNPFYQTKEGLSDYLEWFDPTASALKWNEGDRIAECMVKPTEPLEVYIASDTSLHELDNWPSKCTVFDTSIAPPHVSEGFYEEAFPTEERKLSISYDSFESISTVATFRDWVDSPKEWRSSPSIDDSHSLGEAFAASECCEEQPMAFFDSFSGVSLPSVVNGGDCEYTEAIVLGLKRPNASQKLGHYSDRRRRRAGVGNKKSRVRATTVLTAKRRRVCSSGMRSRKCNGSSKRLGGASLAAYSIGGSGGSLVPLSDGKQMDEYRSATASTKAESDCSDFNTTSVFECFERVGTKEEAVCLPVQGVIEVDEGGSRDTALEGKKALNRVVKGSKASRRTSVCKAKRTTEVMQGLELEVDRTGEEGDCISESIVETLQEAQTASHLEDSIRDEVVHREPGCRLESDRRVPRRAAEQRVHAVLKGGEEAYGAPSLEPRETFLSPQQSGGTLLSAAFQIAIGGNRSDVLGEGTSDVVQGDATCVGYDSGEALDALGSPPLKEDNGGGLLGGKSHNGQTDAGEGALCVLNDTITSRKSQKRASNAKKVSNSTVMKGQQRRKEFQSIRLG